MALPAQGLTLARERKATLLKGEKQRGERSQYFAQGRATPVDRFRTLQLVDALALLALGRREFEPQLVLQPLAVQGIGGQNDQVIDLQGPRRQGRWGDPSKGLGRQHQELGPIAMAAPELPPEARMAGPELLGQAWAEPLAPKGRRRQ
jgi:hypothetical protein